MHVYNDNEQCIHCLSRNYFHVSPDSLAWACWNCQATHWLDDGRTTYMLMEDIDGETAEQALRDGNVSLATIIDVDIYYENA